MKQSPLQTNLLGVQLKPNPDLMVDWKLRPALDESMTGRIRAIWVAEGGVMVVLEGPHGDTWETLLRHHLVVNNDYFGSAHNRKE